MQLAYSGLGQQNLNKSFNVWTKLKTISKENCFK